MRSALLLVAILLAAAPAAAQPEGASLPPPTSLEVPEPPRPFEQGTQQIGLLLGFSSGAGGDSAFSFGASYGYYVLPGLAPGLEVVATAASKSASTLEVSPFLRYVLYRSYALSPFVVAKAGRLFVGEGLDDLTIVGGGGGIVWFISRNVGLTVSGIYEKYLPDSACGDACDAFGLSVGFGWFP